jgi:uncharacterized protein YlaN (UPF0358 family)
MSTEEEIACVNSLALMQSCPLLKDVKSAEMFKLCLDIQRYDLAALLLPLTSTQGRKLLIEVQYFLFSLFCILLYDVHFV